MPDRAIFLYANHPVIRYDGSYYVEFRNFIDFLNELAKLDDVYRLVVPCKEIMHPVDTLPSIALSGKVIEVSYYEGHHQAIIESFRNALRVRSEVLRALRKGRVTVAGPGPNSFLFWLSLFVPKSTGFAFFIRGDTLRTVQHIYRGRLVCPVAKGLVRLFRNRIHSLVHQKRARVFVFGERLKKQYQGPESAIHVISPQIDRHFVRKGMRPPIPEGEPLKILYVGRLSEEKNIVTLLDACALASRKGPEATLSIVGTGPLERKICDRTAALGLLGRAKFLGYVPHGSALIAQYDSHHMVCLPSYTEGIPRTVIEAFGRGMPVLATRVGSLPSLFPEEIKFLDGFGAKDILRGIEWCSEHRAEFSDMGKKGRKAIGGFLINENAVKVDKILRFLA